MRTLTLTLLALSLATQTAAQSANTKQRIASSIDARFSHYAGVADRIWSFAEMGYQEKQSSALLQSELKAAGFTVRAGVADIPTAFVAEFGSGKPVIGILAEFDALPGLSQRVASERAPIPGQAA